MRPQEAYSFISVVWVRSWAWCQSPHSRYALRLSCPCRASANSRNPRSRTASRPRRPSAEPITPVLQRYGDGLREVARPRKKSFRRPRATRPGRCPVLLSRNRPDDRGAVLTNRHGIRPTRRLLIGVLAGSAVAVAGWAAVAGGATRP